jgi:segregation and condensation protein B
MTNELSNELNGEPNEAAAEPTDEVVKELSDLPNDDLGELGNEFASSPVIELANEAVNLLTTAIPNQLDINPLKQKIEAILYLKGQAMGLDKIAEYAGCDRPTAEEGLLDLISDYAHRDSALEIAETNAGFALRLKPEFAELVQKIVPADLGRGELKTLAAIALKNPIAQVDLVDLRGSSAYQHIQELVAQGFVRKRRQSDGRSYWLNVTDKFHQYFELKDLSELI